MHPGGLGALNESSAQVLQAFKLKKIRGLENEERLAILYGDTLALYKLMSKNIVVQNPENSLVGLHPIIDRVKSRKINYALF